MAAEVRLAFCNIHSEMEKDPGDALWKYQQGPDVARCVGSKLWS